MATSDEKNLAIFCYFWPKAQKLGWQAQLVGPNRFMVGPPDSWPEANYAASWLPVTQHHTDIGETTVDYEITYLVPDWFVTSLQKRNVA